MTIEATDPSTPSDGNRPNVRFRPRPAPREVATPISEPVPSPETDADADADADAISAAEPDYDVGYRKPPRHTQFKPGRSGNPKGRPKKAKGLQSIVRDLLTQKVAVRTPSGVKKISRIEAVLQKTLEQAMKGTPRALDGLIKLYGSAVPEAQDTAKAGRDEDPTATDLAMLEELRAMMISEQEQQP